MHSTERLSRPICVIVKRLSSSIIILKA